ncbi:F510_1955 family glycosylhydrolase [Cellulosimicrobium funkei]|uniref:F510_1955 family glycosylhydrolase n=1 Tax=Cellulosimicrobium funkei TaxID=264251 RepID=UPI0034490F68
MNPAHKTPGRGWLAAGTVLLLAACAPTPPPAPAVTTLAPQHLPDFGHVHDVQVDPADHTVLIATHTGVWTMPDPFGDDAGQPQRAGAGRQDTMGMTVAVDGTIYASGHPGPGEQTELKTPNLGLIRSTDAATTWEQISLTGEVDLHALNTATIDTGAVRVVGLDSATSRLLISDDSGESWTPGATIEAWGIHVMGADPDTIVATTPTGLQLSRDAGHTFSPDRAAPTLVLVDAGLGGTLVGIDPQGTVWTGSPGSDDWTEHGTTPGEAQAMTCVSDDSPGNQPWILLATDTGLFTSRDLGASWEPALGQEAG